VKFYKERDFNGNGNVISYNLRITQEYFQPKTGRKIRIFSLGLKNNILIKIKKECNCKKSKFSPSWSDLS